MNLSNSLMLVLLLGTTSSLAGALGTVLTFVLVISIYGLAMAPLRSRMTGRSVLLASLVLAATLTSCADLLAQGWFLTWHQSFGLYVGLIALQCVVLEHHGFFRQPQAVRLRLSTLFVGLMFLLAVAREVSGTGSLARGLTENVAGLPLFSEALRLATLVPGAFIILGLLLAARQAWTRSNSISKETHRP